MIYKQFLFKYIFCKSQFWQKFFKIKEIPYFGVILAQRKFFLKTLGKYNCSGPPPFRYQRNKVDWAGHQTKIYSITISMQKSFSQYAQFIKSFVRYTWYKSSMVYTASLIFYHAHQTIIKVTLSFAEFVSTWKINSILRYSRFLSLKT